MDNSQDIFLGVMDLQEARNHQIRLRSQGVELELKSHDETCTRGCKVTVEVWGKRSDEVLLQKHFTGEYLKNLKGHLPNFDHLNSVYDPTESEAICQACGMKFSPQLKECPDCGLVYS